MPIEVFHTVGWIAGWILFVAILGGYLISIFTDRDYFAIRWLAPIFLLALLILLLSDVKAIVQAVFF